MARYTNFSSTELTRACAGSKDEEAWTEFIRRFHVVIAAAVLRTARHCCEPSRPQLDDLIQDTYLKLCENDSRLLRSFQPRHQDSIYGFLKVVAANVVHDHFKSALAAKRGVGQTDAILGPVQMDPKTARTDSFDAAVSQRLQLEHAVLLSHGLVASSWGSSPSPARYLNPPKPCRKANGRPMPAPTRRRAIRR